MSTTHRPGRTVATIVALGLVGAGVGVNTPTATAATLTKTVSLKVAQYPRLIDNPGDDYDVVRFTNVPGAAWTLDDAAVSFPQGASIVDMPVTAASTAVLAAASDGTTTWTLPAATPTEWDFAKPSADAAPDINLDAVSAVWTDNPGAKRDTVTLTMVPGVVWSVTTGGKLTTYDAASFGAKPTRTLPVTADTTVEAAAAPGYTLPAGRSFPEFSNTTTADVVVTYSAQQLADLVTVGENPHDSVKGFGPGAARESVRITGAAGIKWKVGSLAAKSVTGVEYLPVNPADIKDDNTVEVQPIAAKGYSVPTDLKVPVDFSDGATIPTITPTDGDVTPTDAAGTTADTLTLVGQQGMTWWVGQADAKGVIAYRPQKPAKNGIVTYRVAHARTGEAPTRVYVKAVADRGFVVDTTKLVETSFDFSRDTRTVAADNVSTAGSSVTFRPHEGVVSWSVKYSGVVGTRTVVRSLTVNANTIAAANAEAMTITFPGTPTVAAPKLAKSYVLAP